MGKVSRTNILLTQDLIKIKTAALDQKRNLLLGFCFFSVPAIVIKETCHEQPKS